MPYICDHRYVAAVITPLKIRVQRDDAVEVRAISGYVQETAYPVT